MQIAKTSKGDLEMTLTLDEFRDIKDCLNEVCHGFRIADFRARIGAEKHVAVGILDQFVAPLRRQADDTE